MKVFKIWTVDTFIKWALTHATVNGKGLLVKFREV